MYKLEIGDKLSGFLIKNKKQIDDISATMYEMEHEGCGAKLIFLDREDENKTFSVGFKTIPENSTGVFHIIEHSVLCGSQKYPVKEPFVELIKSSLQTFLNAVTFPDKTVYPISSRNDKDFLNLASVYLDAVFHPAMLTNKSVFLQEGWRRELDEDGNLSYNGVVFNEMKGAYSSPEELGETLLLKELYGSSCYGYDSGGCPDEIPNLSYEEFIESFKKFYHPSNAYFFLDGSVCLEDALSLIESYIGSYDRREPEFDIEDTWAGKESYSEAEYEISPEESEENKARLLAGFIATRFDEGMEKLALDILFDAIGGTNESPLQKEILSSGLCEKMGLYVSSSGFRNHITAEFTNVKDGSADELFELFESALSRLRQNGINREHLEASMNRFEFNLRERDLGGLPMGVAFDMSVFDTWLYGGNPAAALEFSEDFKKLRSLMNGDYFESLIEKYILKNEKRARLLLKPSKTLGVRRAEEEALALAREKEKLAKEAIEAIERESEALSLWQNSQDSIEALASIPTLDVSDIPATAKVTPIEILDGDSVIRHDMKLSGISYTELYFDASDTAENELFALPFLAAMLKSSGTEGLDAYSFENVRKRELGSLSVAPVVFSKNGEARIFIKIGISLLDSKKAVYTDILKKLLYETTLSDKDSLSKLVRQRKIMLTSAFAAEGNSYGVRRAMAYRDAASAIREKLSGYDFYVKLKEFEAEIEKNIDSLISVIKSLREKLFTRERLTLSIAGEADESFEGSIFASLKTGDSRPMPSAILPLGKRDEGIAIPSRVGFAASVSNLSDIGKSLDGAVLVSEMILNYEYLWCEVRVKGGAYGVSLRVGNDGKVAYSSYRDPSPEESLKIFKSAHDFLREFAESDVDLGRYIIGAMGEFEPYLSEPSKAAVSTSRYLSGYTEERRALLRSQILSADKAALLKVADTLRELSESFDSLLVAPKEKISAEAVLYL